MEEPGFLFFPRNQGDGFKVLQDPCTLDCPGENETITLTIDRIQPDYLFISIGGELRRCVDLTEERLTFPSRKAAMRFLKKIGNSFDFQQMIQHEHQLNQAWENL